MAQYIDKDALAAEIERKIEAHKETLKNCDSSISEMVLKGSMSAYQSFLHFLDTLEAKELDLENSMVCKVDWYDGFLLDYTQEQQDELLEKIGANVGDKIRVILIKE